MKMILDWPRRQGKSLFIGGINKRMIIIEASRATGKTKFVNMLANPLGGNVYVVRPVTNHRSVDKNVLSYSELMEVLGPITITTNRLRGIRWSEAKFILEDPSDNDLEFAFAIRLIPEDRLIAVVGTKLLTTKINFYSLWVEEMTRQGRVLTWRTNG